MTSIQIKSDNYKEAVKNKLLVEIIEKVIAVYPLSYVNIERLRKEVDNLQELFWIKNNEGKFLLVNERFAANFHLTPYQMEGKHVDKFIPAYMINFNKALEDYIAESGSLFVIEGFPLSGAPAMNYQVIEIPVRSPEGNLNAIIGVAQEVKKREETANLFESIKLFSSLLKKYILINNENFITEVSEEFCTVFSLVEDELKGKKYNSELSGIPVIIKKMIDDFIESGSKAYSVKVKIPVIQDEEFKLHFIKGRDNEILLLAETILQDKDFSNENNSENISYDFIVDNNPEPSFIYDKENLRFLRVNDPALKLYGYRKDEFLQLDLTDLYAPEDIQSLLESPDEQFISPKPHKQKKKGGENIFVEINRININYKNKPAFVNTIKDITPNLRHEKEKQYLTAAFDNTSDLIFITDREGFIKSISSSVPFALGYSVKEMMEASFMTLLIDEDRGKINSSVFQAGLKEKITFDTSLKKAVNEFLKVRLIIKPVFDFNNEVDSYYLISSPVYEPVKEIIKEVVKEVPVKPPPVESVASSVPEINFLSGIFHDLLTPINVILGFVQDLTENIEQISSDQKESLEIINQNRENLHELINQIMEFIQVEKGYVPIKNDKVKITEIIDELKLEVDAKSLFGDNELAFGKISSSLEVITDREKMLKCLTLLVNLVFKITGQKKLYISVSSLDDKAFEISLRNSFNSSSEEFSEKIVQIFAAESGDIRIPGSPSFIHKYLKNLLKLLKGEVRIKKDGEKSDVTFVFPAELKEKTEESSINGIINDTLSSGIEFTEETIIKHDFEQPVQSDIDKEDILLAKGINLSHLSCLYIEDQLDSQMLFSMQMKDLKEIKFAVSLEQSIPLLKNNNFDFIVIDINLQGDYNGLDILKIIRTIPEYENIPVIAVTAYFLPIDKDVYINAGFNDFISKPLLRENLINSLEKILITQV